MSAVTAMETAADVLEIGRPFALESGQTLETVRVAYRCWGRPSPAGDNAVLVCHALTGSADVDLWWGGLLGEGRALDTNRDFVVCANALGSCYGTTGPSSPGPDSHGRWGPDFPAITVRDMVRLQALLLDHLGVGRVRLVIGGSLGGMQALEWAASFPGRLGSAAVIAAPARQSAWAIALSHAQRAAIAADPRFREGRYPPDDPPREGLAVARMIAMCSYRSWESLEGRFGRNEAPGGGFQVESYLRHQGRKLAARFDANSYIALTCAMDTHDVGRGRGGIEAALGRIEIPVLVVAIDSDVLFPAEEQWRLVEGLSKGRLAWLSSPHGHDAFLIETERLDHTIREFRQTITPGRREEATHGP